MILLGQDAFLSQWVADQVPYSGKGFGQCVTIGHVKNGHVLGAVVFHDYRPEYGSIQMSFAGKKGWLTRGFLRHIWAYPFLQLGCTMVYGCVASRNDKGKDTAERMGAVVDGVLKRGFGDDDLVLYRVLKEDCKWL